MPALTFDMVWNSGGLEAARTGRERACRVGLGVGGIQREDGSEVLLAGDADSGRGSGLGHPFAKAHAFPFLHGPLRDCVRGWNGAREANDSPLALHYPKTPGL